MLERVPAGRDLLALVEDFFRNSFGADNELITEAVRRMLAAGGKRLRPRF
ncbi:MAG: heptaprenyl diphosphate synthase, partial [Candidatus Eremiobacteraeota bacterium]|nr:heptaprenyl diphosphate synthase [Candidatus Eremiobacteraeota bacterium]